MNVFKIIFDISLLRAKPQDIQFSYQLLAITAVTSVVSYFLALEPARPELERILGTQNSSIVMSLAENGFFAATVWVILKLRGAGGRFVQAMTAMFGVSTIIRLLVWLVMGLLATSQESAGAGMAGLLVFGLSLWTWIVYAYIFMNTLDSGFWTGLLFDFISQVVTSMLLLTVIDVNL